MVKLALTLSDIFPSMNTVKEAIKEYIVSYKESFKVTKSNFKKKWIIVCKNEACTFWIQVSCEGVIYI